jgi:ATP-dependent Lon protease
MTEGEPFRDSCLLGTVDTSAMTFIATANKINRIDEGLLERFLVIRFEEPDAEHLDALFTNCRADYSRERGLDIANLVEFNAAKFEVLKRFLKRERSARVFRKVFDILANDLIRDFEATRVLH